MNLKRLSLTLGLGLSGILLSLGLLSRPGISLAGPAPQPLRTILTVGVSPNCATIQSCINTASASDTVFIPNGTYLESLTLNKQVSLAGQSQSGAIIQAPAAGQRGNRSVPPNK